MIRRLAVSLALLMTLLAVAPAPAGAFDPFGAACTGKNNNSAACKTNGSDPISGTNPHCRTDVILPNDDCGVLIRVTRIIAYLAGAIAVIMIIVGSIRFITSGSDVSTGSRTDTDVEEARRTIASALAGLAIIILAQYIITYVIKRL